VSETTAAPRPAVELLEVRDFLGAHPPFDHLAAEDLSALARRIEISYARKGTQILRHGVPNTHLYMIRAGAVDLHENGSDFRARVGEGDYFAFSSLLRDDVTRMAAMAVEDCLLYRLPAAAFRSVIERHPQIARYFALAESDRLRHALERRRSAILGIEDTPLLTARLGELISRPTLHWVGPDLSVAEVARKMTDHDVSTMLILQEGQLRGIFTDKDLRRRVMGQGRAWDTPITAVMTPDPITLPAQASALEALLAMTRHRIHHIPVRREDGAILGIISANDLLGRMSAQALYLADRIARAGSAEAIAEQTARIPDCLVSLVDSGVPAREIGRFLSSVGEAAHVRLAQLAEAELGPPPVAYALLVFGSLARGDQTARSDQDNALLVSDAFQAEAHDGYFRRLAAILCDGLNRAGYVYCPGEIMATTQRWRQPLAAWQAQFHRWITTPDPDAVMHATIFFDQRVIHGDAALIAPLQADIQRWAEGNRIFLAHLTKDALKASLPLGFFRQLVLSRDKDHKDRLNLKQQGTAPLVDIARVYALAHGLSAVNTQDRFAEAERVQALAASDAANLRDAFAFISDVRLRHQAEQIRHGEPPDNFVAPKVLSRFDRDHLKDAFALVRDAQQALALRFGGGLMR